MLLFIPQTPLPNLFLIRLDNVGFFLNASTSAIQNKTNEGISKQLKQVPTTPHSINKYIRVINIYVLFFTGLYEKQSFNCACGLQSDLR